MDKERIVHLERKVRKRGGKFLSLTYCGMNVDPVETAGIGVLCPKCARARNQCERNGKRGIF